MKYKIIDETEKQRSKNAFHAFSSEFIFITASKKPTDAKNRTNNIIAS